MTPLSRFSPLMLDRTGILSRSFVIGYTHNQLPADAPSTKHHATLTEEIQSLPSAAACSKPPNARHCTSYGYNVPEDSAAALFSAF